MRDINILMVGGVGIDTIVQVPHLPLPTADSIHVEPIREYIAHTGNGVALGCVALGLRTPSFATDRTAGCICRRVPDGAGDSFSSAFLYGWRRRGPARRRRNGSPP